MNFVKKFQIFFCFVSGKISLEIVSHDVLKKKKLLTTVKMPTFSEGQKCQFCKGVNPWFWSKNSKFLLLFGGQNEPRIMFHDVLDKKKTILQ